jgi:aspartyl-tRNA synthetase
MASAPFRTHLVKQLDEVPIGTRVRLAGWIAHRRRHKHVTFVGLRDRSGTVQVVCAPSEALDVSRESCVTVSGILRARPELVDRTSTTDQIEVAEGRIEVLNPAAPFPIAVNYPGDPGDALGRWRYLGLRRSDVRSHLLTRAQVATVLRRSVQDEGFVELETPYLAHPSSGGAREFEVVSSSDPARRYVLPQSSQVYRTLLMVGGIERYYQITRNFRDEWMRADRQFEFSVLDVEAAFASRDDIMGTIEAAVARAAGELLGHELPRPFPRIAFGAQPAPERGTSPPLDFRWVVDHPLFMIREGKLDTFHQPFDAPAGGWQQRLDESPLEVRSSYFTLACGDRELGGGSMRIHRPDLLSRVLGLIGQAGANAPIVEALGYGAPPHGGFTLALDGLAALFTGARSIRSVIPFPKSAAGRCPVFSPP